MTLTLPISQLNLDKVTQVGFCNSWAFQNQIYRNHRPHKKIFFEMKINHNFALCLRKFSPLYVPASSDQCHVLSPNQHLHHETITISPTHFPRPTFSEKSYRPRKFNSPGIGSVSICSTSASSSFWSLLSFCPLTTFLSSDMCDADFECWDSLLLYCWPSFSAFSLVSSPLSFR